VIEGELHSIKPEGLKPQLVTNSLSWSELRLICVRESDFPDMWSHPSSSGQVMKVQDIDNKMEIAEGW